MIIHKSEEGLDCQCRCCFLLRRIDGYAFRRKFRAKKREARAKRLPLFIIQQAQVLSHAGFSNLALNIAQIAYQLTRDDLVGLANQMTARDRVKVELMFAIILHETGNGGEAGLHIAYARQIATAHNMRDALTRINKKVRRLKRRFSAVES